MKKTVGAWARQLRLHQWVKNLLLVVPVFTAFEPLSAERILHLVLAFLAFGFAASAVYIFNDLVDLEADRQHPTKKNRPIAAELISPGNAKLAAVLLLIFSAAVAWGVGLGFVGVLLAYLVTTVAYNFWLKKIAIIDAITLAGLYTVRVIAGGIATGIVVSFWLATFAVCLFLSLAWVKRYTELKMWESNQLDPVGRGYRAGDKPLVLTFGVSTAIVAVMVFALYLDSPEIRSTYAQPAWAWMAIPLFTYLVGRIWLKTNRGEMNHDPVIFILRDFPSLVTITLIATVVAIAHVGLPL